MNEPAAYTFPGFPTLSQKPAVKKITVDLTPTEALVLEKYCNQTGKAATDVIMELIQNLS
ncbi:MAG: CopG family transcriptional regulator [Brasilonema octagenarum HA4186-MV1]|uniref:CopG family transcriptional regulator n=2 Tax=Brasilonema TaxID=383614 RepID=A0A856MI52_9CYAN|nr:MULTISPECIES: CopG family transcriptional regulator [Brasilonema]MBW4629399.1 CopG family transcriptional regulator [Brasilonema octagenarum HA4186-MV1]NMF66403.1 CopG family transcriptional regulator [Brasilonema octagenarum UFV-OR1]QDL09939.1 CopG family transcriptional regulator [Brasilonema sennae CENA114]QDL16291.1 CopG family transcriptional regulator [Brasilonema octagenarum UFV-E1]